MSFLKNVCFLLQDNEDALSNHSSLLPFAQPHANFSLSLIISFVLSFCLFCLLCPVLFIGILVNNCTSSQDCSPGGRWRVLGLWCGGRGDSRGYWGCGGEMGGQRRAPGLWYVFVGEYQDSGEGWGWS